MFNSEVSAWGKIGGENANGKLMNTSILPMIGTMEVNKSYFTNIIVSYNIHVDLGFDFLNFLFTFKIYILYNIVIVHMAFDRISIYWLLNFPFFF